MQTRSLKCCCICDGTGKKTRPEWQLSCGHKYHDACIRNHIFMQYGVDVIGESTDATCASCDTSFHISFMEKGLLIAQGSPSTENHEA
tara:strand:- start:422 stop:685 length:264 start_codon:yes stop_codon:yes gene_type:complete